MHRRRHYIYPDQDSLIESFCCDVSTFLEESKELDRPIHIALSGGSTPIAIFDQLAEITTPEEWQRIHLYWGDESCVEPWDEQSNFGNAQKHLIDPLGLQDHQVHRIMGEEDPEGEAERYGTLLRDMLPVEYGSPIFDWIWLGVGEDGHTASIFPDQIELWKAESTCVVGTHPATGQRRVSLSGDVINAARRVSFIVAGTRKSAVINDIVMKEGRYLDYPAFYVNPSSGNLEWFLDKDATNWL
ncbi:MAG: 6-phosphogluconolactonase [Bacteroidota bacterium]